MGFRERFELNRIPKQKIQSQGNQFFFSFTANTKEFAEVRFMEFMVDNANEERKSK